VEEFYKQRLSRRFAQLVTSGEKRRYKKKSAFFRIKKSTTALSTAMMVADVGPGDEVCVPGYLWVACLSAVVRLRGIPRLVNIDDTFYIDLIDLERKINNRTKVVLLMYMSGCSGHMDRSANVCKFREVLLIEDIAQANEGSFGGKPLSLFGDLAIFSF
jgi:dTDP-4-amino-4,6-dideoxygalactose transaminase